MVNVCDLTNVNLLTCDFDTLRQPRESSLNCNSLIALQIELPHCSRFIIIQVPAIDKSYPPETRNPIPDCLVMRRNQWGLVRWNIGKGGSGQLGRVSLVWIYLP